MGSKKKSTAKTIDKQGDEPKTPEVVRESVTGKYMTTEPVNPPKEPRLAYVSPIAANVHEGMTDLFALGLVDKVTMDQFDASSLMPVAELRAPDIKALRTRENVSQSVFAKYLGIAVNTLSQWERGARRPDGPALKLLSLVERHGLDYIR